MPKIQQDFLPKATTPYYGGKFQDLIDGQDHDIYCAGNGSVITKIGYAGVKDTAAAIRAAKDAQQAWAKVSPANRAKHLREAAQILREHAVELASIDAYNIGSPVTIMTGDANVAADQLEFFAGLIPAVTGETHNVGSETFNYTIREPLGVVARIVASNHPLMFGAAKLAAPLAVGNTVIIKPPEQAPLSAIRMMELIGHVFPPGVVAVLPGGVECGTTLATHPDISKVTLIGSVPVARLIQKQAAETLKRTLFELGGKNALVAFPDASKKKLVQGIIAGMNWAWCGQSCGSTSRVFLHESHYDEIIGLVVEELKKRFYPGDPLDEKTTMGSMVSKAAQDRVLSYIEKGKQEGARLVTGGKVPTSQDTKGGYFVEPTIFADVTQDMTIAREEIFGPVMSVIRWSGDEDALFAQVNSVEYGLTGSVFTQDIETMHRAVRSMQAGTVWVNTVGKHFLGLPFGGYKQSGIGREECLEEMLEMTQPKAVHVQL